MFIVLRLAGVPPGKTFLWARATSEEGIEVIGPRSDRKLRASTEEALPGKAWALQSESSGKVRTKVDQTGSTTLVGNDSRGSLAAMLPVRTVSDQVTEVTSLL